MIEVFKSVAGHNLRYSPVAVKEALKLELLVENNVKIYYESKLIDEPAIADPIAVTPVLPDPLIYSGRINEYLRNLKEIYSMIVPSRITNCYNKTIKHHICCENLEKYRS